MIQSETASLKQKDRIFTKLVELGVNERWLTAANLSTKEATQLLKGILYLREMHANCFTEDQ